MPESQNLRADYRNNNRLDLDNNPDSLVERYRMQCTCLTSHVCSVVTTHLHLRLWGPLGHSAAHLLWHNAGSKWLGKHSLDDDRPLGRGMRLKQEPAYIQDSSFASGTPLLSVVCACRFCYDSDDMQDKQALHCNRYILLHECWL